MKNYLLFFVISFISFSSSAQISLIQFATGLSSPLDIQSAGDDRMFVVEQGGRIKILDTTGAVQGTFLNISTKIVSGGELGLLGLAFDPDYKNNGFFYVNYTVTLGSFWETHISRFQVSATDPDSADAGSEKILLKIFQPYSNHNGGGLAFSPKDSMLYIGLGDGGSGGDPQNRAQNLDSLLGKMLRIDVRDTLYKIPSDNPYVGISGRDEIWASGLRNPFRYGFDSWNGDLWIGDVGQNAWEEIDYQSAVSTGGENYGWRCYEGNHAYQTGGCGPMSSYEPAVYEFAHSGGAAVIGGYVYRGAEYANMFAKYFLSDEYTSKYGVRTLTTDGLFNDSLLGALGAGTIVSFGEDQWKELYVVDYQGKVFKFKGADCSPVAYLSDKDTMFIYGCDTTDLFGNALEPLVLRTPSGRDFHYQWMTDGTVVNGNDNDSLLVYRPGDYNVTVTNRDGCSATASVKVVNPLAPQITINVDHLGEDIPGVLCYYPWNPGIVNLSATPLGGAFTGTGVINGNSFCDSCVSPGQYYTIYYTIVDSVTACNYVDSISFLLAVCEGIEELPPFSFSISPNPAKDKISIDIDSYITSMSRVELRDITGRLLFTQAFLIQNGKQSHEIPVNFSSGIYLLSITADGKSINKKVVIQ